MTFEFLHRLTFNNHQFTFFRSIIPLTLLLVLAPCFSAVAENITDIDEQHDNGKVLLSWVAYGTQWKVSVEKNMHLGESIQVIEVAVRTGNEQLKLEAPNCYYRGSLIDDSNTPIPNTHAHINFCHSDLPFAGFVSTPDYVYTIVASDTSVTGIAMHIDDQNLPVPYEGIYPFHGEPNTSIPDGLLPRTRSSVSFPSVEFAVEPAYVKKIGEDKYFDRIIEALDFSNFTYEQSGIKPVSLVAITLLDENLIWSGGQGSVRSNIQNFRMRTAQTSSADMLLLYLGSNINTNNRWGWAEDGYACDIRRAVAENINLATVNIGRSTGFLTPVPSLIQRGNLLAHEIGHLLNAVHVKKDPVMDAHFLYLPSLADYVASCKAISYIYESCTYNKKTWKFTDYYNCN